MIWKTNTHLFSATVCQHTGKNCPAVNRMAEKLAQAIAASKPITTDDFEIEGDSVLKHCPHDCHARFVATHDRIRIFCDVTSEIETSDLNRFADALLKPSSGPITLALSQSPCALVEVLPIKPSKQDTVYACA